MITTSSNAKVFFEGIFVDHGQSMQKLQELISTQADENEWREFKGAYHATHVEGALRSQKLEELRAIWSKAIGAFANASGGVLIWGIDAPNKFAERTSLAKDADVLAVKLTEWVNGAAIPHVHGIDIRAVKEAQSQEGFVVCFIPASRFAPHQSIWPQKQFFMRCQDGSHECGYTELKRLFQPALGAIYEAVASATAYSLTSGDHGLGAAINVQIKNVGTATAKDLLITINGGGFLQENEIWKTLAHNAVASNSSVHPERVISLRVAGYQLVGGREYPKDFAVQFKLKIYSRDTKPFEFDFHLPWEELKQAKAKNSHYHAPGLSIGPD
ncbi:MAG: hypothetical protein NTY98_18505 [Verrucomicrobia bacterium]|nr:hypothetical protein [Verrucomicrobiota bacterium]